MIEWAALAATHDQEDRQIIPQGEEGARLRSTQFLQTGTQGVTGDLDIGMGAEEGAGGFDGEGDLIGETGEGFEGPAGFDVRDEEEAFSLAHEAGGKGHGHSQVATGEEKDVGAEFTQDAPGAEEATGELPQVAGEGAKADAMHLAGAGWPRSAHPHA